MRKMFGTILFVLIATSIIGCVGPGIEGKYYNVNNTNSYIELKPDGTFFAHYRDMSINTTDSSGTYKIENDIIILSIPMETDTQGVIRGGNIFADLGYREGDMWSKTVSNK